MKGIIQNVIIYKCLKIHILINSFTVRSSKKKKNEWVEQLLYVRFF